MATTEELLKTVLAAQKDFLSALNAINGINKSVTVPPFQPFQQDKSTWEIYIQQLEQHFKAYKVVSDDDKKAYFLSWLGTDTYALLQNLLGCEKVADKQYKELTDKLADHFKEQIHVSMARYDFWKCRLQAGQTYSEWIANLRGLARSCKFACSKEGCNTEFVDEMIRDVIVLHTPHDAVRTASLQKTNATLTEVIAIAEAFEATQKSLKIIKNNNIAERFEVNHIGSPETNREERSRRRSKSRASNDARKTSNAVKSCPGCWKNHDRDTCRFLKVQCRKCGKKGHIGSVCLSGNNNKSSHCSRFSQNRRSDQVQQIDYIFTVGDVYSKESKLIVDVVVNGHRMEFLLDTGASCSLVGIPGYSKLGSPPCSKTHRALGSYGNTRIPVLGELQVSVEIGSKGFSLPLLVTNVSTGRNIFGLNWFKAFGFEIRSPVADSVLNMSTVHNVASAMSHDSSLQRLLSEYSDLISPTLGLCGSVKAHLYLKQGARPKFFKSRPIPFALTDLFKLEAKRLEDAGIWKPVRFSEWAAPIVLVTKRNNQLRICGDFKVTINPNLEVDQHPIPRVEELFQKLAGGKIFSKIDLADAYLQIELDDESKALAVVNTPLGLYQYQRLPFGIASAPAIYQRTLEQVLSGLNCVIYLDDILVSGKDEEDHLRNLKAVFQRLSEHGLRINRNKSSFSQSEVEYLGHVINAQGIQPSPSGTIAIEKIPRPKNLNELQTFLGKINYYGKFVRNLSQIAAPLNMLRKKNVPFTWGPLQENAFQSLKLELINATRLVHYQPDLPIVLATDASSYGIGAVISHVDRDGIERPIAFASKTLDVHQKGYSQIEKEALSIIYGVKKFHQFLYGREFTLITDHKPLVSLFNPDKGLPTMTANRLQRWALILMAYKYKILYRPTAKHANADALSRFPVGTDTQFDFDEEETCLEITLEYAKQVEDFPVSQKSLVAATDQDHVLRRVRRFILKGWPDKLSTRDKDLQPFFNRRLSLGIYEGVILLQTEYSRVVVPASWRNKITDMLHEGHWGMVRMKQLARRYCWWPQIDKQIETRVAACKTCQVTASDPPREFSPWPCCEKPWQRVHVDFAGPFTGEMWLICVDAFSKFPFVVPMKNNTTTAATILALNRIFTLEGLPEAIVTDNGPQFSAATFAEFCTSKGIQHLRTAPFHPASNGEAERFVRTFKSNFKKILEDDPNTELALSKYLSTFRMTPNPKSGKSPAELLHGRQHRNLFSQLIPEGRQSTDPSKELGKKFQVNQPVYVRNYARGPRWLEGIIVKQIGAKMFEIRTERGLWRRHQNQIKARVQEYSLSEGFPEALRAAEAATNQASNFSNNTNSVVSSSEHPRPILKTSSPDNSTPRRSSRTRRPVVRFQP